MKPDVQFVEEQTPWKLRLSPIGHGFLPLNKLQELNDSVAAAQITNAKRHFRSLQNPLQTSMERNTERKARAFKPYICKSAYILSKRVDSAGEAELIELLSDSATLFSYDYQIYCQDHDFYREVRSRQGKSVEQQNQYCREQALKDTGAERDRYEQYLIQLENKAMEENWSPDQLDEALAEQAISHQITPEEISAFFQWAKVQMADDNFVSSFSENLPEIELSPNESRYFLAHFFNVVGCEENAMAEYYARILVYHLPECCCTYQVLQQWIPGLYLAEDERESFVSDVLYPYICARKRIFTEKASAGQYSPTYRVCDKINCELFLKAKKQLTDLRERQKSWPKENINAILRLVQTKTEYSISSVVSNESIPAQFKPMFPALCAVTKDYFSSVGGHPEKFKECHIRSVIFEMDQLGVGISHFPYSYLMICIAGTSALFSAHYTISREIILRSLQKPYHKNLSRKKQRISRIRFLDNLNKACRLKKNERSSNWKLFLQTHGTSVESPEEASLWREILYSQDKATDSPNEDIPPIELALRCESLLHQCLPVQEQYLYCYCNCSVLQMGGYAAFLKACPNVLESCIERIKKQLASQPSKKTAYLKACSGLTYDVNHIRRICAELANLIRWGTIPSASSNELKQFCASLHKTKAVTEDEIDCNVRELKNLLIETSLRHILAEEASVKLRKKVEEVFSDGSDFGISLANL